jgi:alkylation response protein AidB-like acyl-CoA dehydrogenase
VHAVEVLQAVAHLSSNALRERIYKAIVEGNAFLANASSERHSRDPLSWNTTFKADPNRKGVVINGEKFYSTGSLAADYLYVGSEA